MRSRPALCSLHLAAGRPTAFRQVLQHLLAELAGLVDHRPTLGPGPLDLGVGRDARSSRRRTPSARAPPSLDLRRFADARRDRLGLGGPLVEDGLGLGQQCVVLRRCLGTDGSACSWASVRTAAASSRRAVASSVSLAAVAVASSSLSAIRRAARSSLSATS